MKYGVIMHKETANMGDDIQTYAAAKLLPSVDYIIDREHIDTFRTENEEAVSVVMSGWWFWQKWNWPPAKCINPLLLSIHLNNYTIYNRGTPIKDKWLEGIGGEYLKKYGPVGVRDKSSLTFFEEHDIDTYFSGCITLTLPKQKKTEDAGEYVVIADLNEKLKKKAYEYLEGTNLKVVEVSHRCKYRGSDATFEERMKAAEDLLTLYQNARCVITRRLHVSLPCLAMEVPVISIVDLKEVGNITRWEPYHEWLHYVSNEDFFEHNFEYDFVNPPKNKEDYKKTRQALIDSVNAFVKESSSSDKTAEELYRLDYTDQEIKDWQYDLMKWTLEEWLHSNRGMMKRYNDSKSKVESLKKDVANYKKQLADNRWTVRNFAKKVVKKLKK
ncbi:MAG: polysaccharide pyruvyl transferase family protein [Eubacteriales bacterium]|nr:polysaccharide pyruvyl transferase family protein [Eubacteriales bacterium]